jgi:hypothetical protein
MKEWVKNLHIAAWLLTAAALLAAFIAWGQGFSWQFAHLSTYQIFPVFGLVAFSTMWAQYIIRAIKEPLDLHSAGLSNYFHFTSWLVVIAILLHPGLLSWQLWRDGLGLPPGSELAYVGPMLHAAVVIGMTCFFIFLAFELRVIFAKYSWWRYAAYIQDAAIVAIFYHALRLGTQTKFGWFQKLWWFYGISLILALGCTYAARINNLRHRFQPESEGKL